MLTRSLALAFLFVCTLAACDSTRDFEIGGVYSGISQQSSDGTATLTLTIPATGTGETFQFSATVVEMDGQGTTVSRSTVLGTGTYDYPAITVTVDGGTAAGTVSEFGDQITLDDGTGLGSFVLTRQ